MADFPEVIKIKFDSNLEWQHLFNPFIPVSTKLPQGQVKVTEKILELIG